MTGTIAGSFAEDALSVMYERDWALVWELDFDPTNQPETDGRHYI